MCNEHICNSCRKQKRCLGSKLDPMTGQYWPEGLIGIFLIPFCAFGYMLFFGLLMGIKVIQKISKLFK